MNIVKKSGLSKSKWIADRIKEKTTNTWPDSVVKLSGAWKDLPTAEEIREGMGSEEFGRVDGLKLQDWYD